MALFLSAVKQLNMKNSFGVFEVQNLQYNPSFEYFVFGAGTVPLQTNEIDILSQWRYTWTPMFILFKKIDVINYDLFQYKKIGIIMIKDNVWCCC